MKIYITLFTIVDDGEPSSQVLGAFKTRDEAIAIAKSHSSEEDHEVDFEDESDSSFTNEESSEYFDDNVYVTYEINEFNI